MWNSKKGYGSNFGFYYQQFKIWKHYSYFCSSVDSLSKGLFNEAEWLRPAESTIIWTCSLSISLFSDEWMRKNTKSLLYCAFIPINILDLIGKYKVFVVDGGYLLHKVTWLQNVSFKSIVKSYISYLKKKKIWITGQGCVWWVPICGRTKWNKKCSKNTLIYFYWRQSCSRNVKQCPFQDNFWLMIETRAIPIHCLKQSLKITKFKLTRQKKTLMSWLLPQPFQRLKSLKVS